MKIGVVGMGNLGNAVKREIERSGLFELVACFSKRDVEGCEKVENIPNYVGKIDTLFLCGGSQNELEKQTEKYLKDFNIVEAYDNHNRLCNYVKRADLLAKENKKVAFCAFGWDPGLFSLMRALFEIVGYKPFTTWGVGVSQGHTQAVKNLNGVFDAVQFTIPLKREVERIEKGLQPRQNLHKRLCFVVCDKAKRKEIKEKIVTMQDYFRGYKTTVRFVSQEKLSKLKNFSHKGRVFCEGNVINFNLDLPSNPAFTARVMVGYARAVEKLSKRRKYGAYTIFDVPLSDVLGENVMRLL